MMIIGMLCLRLEVVYGLQYKPLILAGRRWSLFVCDKHVRLSCSLLLVQQAGRGAVARRWVVFLTARSGCDWPSWSEVLPPTQAFSEAKSMILNRQKCESERMDKASTVTISVRKPTNHNGR